MSGSIIVFVVIDISWLSSLKNGIICVFFTGGERLLKRLIGSFERAGVDFTEVNMSINVKVGRQMEEVLFLFKARIINLFSLSLG